MGGDVQWLQSYVTQDKLYCVYIAPNEERVVRARALRLASPPTPSPQVGTTIDPTASEARVTA